MANQGKGSVGVGELARQLNLLSQDGIAEGCAPLADLFKLFVGAINVVGTLGSASHARNKSLQLVMT